jgi:hypothetical protein
MRLTLASSSKLMLLAFFLHAAVGCTSTEAVVESWRGHPIEEVVAQWGPPGDYDSVSSGFSEAPTGEFMARTDSREQAIRPGARSYTWSQTTHQYNPEYTETVARTRGDETIYTTRVIPAKWKSDSAYFKLTTDEDGRVDGGRSSDSRKIWPFNLFFEKSRGWGSPRHDGTAKQSSSSNSAKRKRPKYTGRQKRRKNQRSLCNFSTKLDDAYESRVLELQVPPALSDLLGVVVVA